MPLERILEVVSQLAENARITADDYNVITDADIFAYHIGRATAYDDTARMIRELIK